MKKGLISAVIFIVILNLFSSSVFAEGAMAPTAKEHAQAKDTYSDEGKPNFVNLVVSGVWGNMWEYVCMMGDINACTTKVGRQSFYFQNSVLGYTTNGIAALYINKPVDSGQFLAYYGQRIGIIKPAYAQGIGFYGLQPLLPLWKAFRNIAYSFIIIVMVVIGFMVLFRMKIDPRTVISIQNAIPRIIVTLILITFSYLIVGLLIDLMYFIIFVCMAALSSAVHFPQFQSALTGMSGGALPNLFGAVFTPGTRAIDDISKILFGAENSQMINWITAVILTGGGAAVGGSVIGGIILGGAGALLSAATIPYNQNPLVALLVWLALFFTLIRIFFTLLNAYIQVLVAVIFAPLQIMFDAIPNLNAFSSWFKNLIGNLAVFPITALMLLIGMLLSDAATKFPNLWTPPGLSGWPTNNIGSGVAGVIGLGIVFIIPNIANSFKEMLKAKPFIPSGTGAVFAPITSVYGTAMGGLSQMYYLTQMRQMLPSWFPGASKPKQG